MARDLVPRTDLRWSPVVRGGSWGNKKAIEPYGSCLGRLEAPTRDEEFLSFL